MSSEKLDKTAFSMGSFKDASHQFAWWKTKSLKERLEAAWLLTCRVYGVDPVNPPKMDRSYFSMRKHSG